VPCGIQIVYTLHGLLIFIRQWMMSESVPKCDNFWQMASHFTVDFLRYSIVSGWLPATVSSCLLVHSGLFSDNHQIPQETGSGSGNINVTES
jgi:hypothetical protein